MLFPKICVRQSHLCPEDYFLIKQMMILLFCLGTRLWLNYMVVSVVINRERQWVLILKNVPSRTTSKYESRSLTTAWLILNFDRVTQAWFTHDTTISCHEQLWFKTCKSVGAWGHSFEVLQIRWSRASYIFYWFTAYFHGSKVSMYPCKFFQNS